MVASVSQQQSPNYKAIAEAVLDICKDSTKQKHDDLLSEISVIKCLLNFCRRCPQKSLLSPRDGDGGWYIPLRNLQDLYARIASRFPIHHDGGTSDDNDVVVGGVNTSSHMETTLQDNTRAHVKTVWECEVAREALMPQLEPERKIILSHISFFSDFNHHYASGARNATQVSNDIGSGAFVINARIVVRPRIVPLALFFEHRFGKVDCTTTMTSSLTPSSSRVSLHGTVHLDYEICNLSAGGDNDNDDNNDDDDDDDGGAVELRVADVLNPSVLNMSECTWLVAAFDPEDIISLGHMPTITVMYDVLSPDVG
jgi:hypothetical protein